MPPTSLPTEAAFPAPDPRYIADLSRAAAALSVIRQFAVGEYPGRLAVVSSFGAESAVLLHLVATVDPALPVLFIDTGMHFPETLAYRRHLADRLELADVRDLTPDQGEIARQDGAGKLHATDPDACCRLRKVDPFAAVAGGFAACLTGRKRYHGAARSRLPLVEIVDGVVRINPLADWTGEDMTRYAGLHDLPAHPLVGRGYPSIGCAPCTRPAAEGGDIRAGRWEGTEKTECGIHLPATGTNGR